MTATPARRRYVNDKPAQAVLLAGSLLFMTVGLLLPLGELAVKCLTDANGAYVGPDNFIRFFSAASLARALYHSLYVSLMSTLAALPPAFLFAYSLTRTTIPGKAFFRHIAMLPLFAPTMLLGVSLVYLFGRKGIVTSGLFGALPWLGIDIGLYGSTGIIIAEAILVFPPSVMILLTALANSDARLYEAAESLGANKPEIFWSVTLPGVKYGVTSAAFVCFTLVFTDFGVPKVVGGNYGVLATDIYKQVVGQQNFNLGATISVVMLLPTLLAFIADNWLRRRQEGVVNSRSIPLVPKRNATRDLACFAFCLCASSVILAVFLTALFASLANLWPYRLTPTLRHYNFRDYAGGGYLAFWNSVRMAGYSALLGTAMTFGSAYLVEKTRKFAWARRTVYCLSLAPLALPGLVVGLAYIFLFNSAVFSVAGREIPNPLSRLYGTMLLLVVCNVVHFYTVGFLTASAALRQLDREFEAAAESLSVPFYATFRRVTLPLCLPAVIDIAGYFFVSSMATVSAVIFLYTPDLQLASVAVVNMDDAGDSAPAAAMSILIVAANIMAKAVFELASRRARKAAERWRNR
ncbi:MAG: putative 2-aminoethylphosphonate ABC transporter permease subunit [Planctomycetota bacterium]|jgi:iron(III) transport system permease protein|nr:putative 2-aminoethylphosphonate ABC transporter permease subunit [Planctomycetota bacterium]